MDVIAFSKSVLSATPRRWLDLARTLPAELLYRQPAEGEWSAMQCLGHLVDTEMGVFPFRVAAILKGEDFPAFDPDKEGNQIPAPGGQLAFAEKFAGLREQALEVLAQVGPGDLARTGTHSQLGVVTLGQLVHEWAGHDLMHTVQGERAMMQPFIDGCGPWQVYFTDHWVQK